METLLLSSFRSKEATQIIEREFQKRENLAIFVVSEHFQGYKAAMFTVGKNGYIRKTKYFVLANKLEDLRDLLPIKKYSLRRMERFDEDPAWIIERWC